MNHQPTLSNSKIFDRTENQSRMRKKSRFASFQSLLFTILTSEKYWRSIRWCDNGTAVLIPSPQLFEREVLRRELTAWKLKDFASFVKMLKTIGFQRALSARTSKTQKFRHPRFQVDGKEVTGYKLEEKKEQKRKKGKRQMKAKQRHEKKRERQETGIESNGFKKSFETPKTIKRRGEVVTEALRGRTVVKRKRNAKELMNNKHYVYAKRQRQNTCATVSSANQNPPQQPIPRSYCPEEITTAQAMLGLSAPVVFMQNIPVNVMLVHTWVDSYKSFVLFAERGAREIEAAQALMELSRYC